MRRALSIAVAAPLLLSLSCTDFAEPTELSRTQILAVRAAPKAIPEGGTATLDFLLAGPDGEITDPDYRWDVVPAVPGTAPVGSIEGSDATGFSYRAPDLVGEPGTASVQLSATVDGETFTALKFIGIGLPNINNPSLSGLTVDGIEADPGTTVMVTPGQTLALAAALSPTGTSDFEDITFAWYCSLGEIDPIRGETVSLIIADDATGSAPLFVVGRDGIGGVAWRRIEIAAQ